MSLIFVFSSFKKVSVYRSVIYFEKFIQHFIVTNSYKNKNKTKREKKYMK